MYNKEKIDEFIGFIKNYKDCVNFNTISDIVKNKFNMDDNKNILVSDCFYVKFCFSNNNTKSNTVLSLSKLKKFDDKPFIILFVTPNNMDVILANSTFIDKLSHSSKNLRLDNIVGSFNYSNIIKKYNTIDNISDNFEILFNIHSNYTFEENLKRIILNTNNIKSQKVKYEPTTQHELNNIKDSVKRALMFNYSKPYYEVLELLNKNVKENKEHILKAFNNIKNTNIKNNVIEFLVHPKSNTTKINLISALNNNTQIPHIYLDHGFSDCNFYFGNYNIKVDIKIKDLNLLGNPKGYNIDEFNRFLSKDNTIYLLFFIAFNGNEILTQLCSPFDISLNNTKVTYHWCGKERSGTAQFYDKDILAIFNNDYKVINTNTQRNFLYN